MKKNAVYFEKYVIMVRKMQNVGEPNHPSRGELMGKMVDGLSYDNIHAYIEKLKFTSHYQFTAYGCYIGDS